MHNPEYLLDNVTHKLLWDFEMQTVHLISATLPDFIIINEKKRELAELWTLLSRLTTVKLKEKEKKDKYLELARERKKKNCGA